MVLGLFEGVLVGELGFELVEGSKKDVSSEPAPEASPGLLLSPRTRLLSVLSLVLRDSFSTSTCGEQDGGWSKRGAGPRVLRCSKWRVGRWTRMSAVATLVMAVSAAGVVTDVEEPGLVVVSEVVVEGVGEPSRLGPSGGERRLDHSLGTVAEVEMEVEALVAGWPDWLRLTRLDFFIPRWSDHNEVTRRQSRPRRMRE